MSDFGEAMGTVVTGGLYANALEPQAGKGGKGHTHEGACLNCGTELVGPHCHGCGQRAHVHRTLGAFFHDLLHGVLHFEGKTWRTLPLLATKPGKLTREYIEGKRAKYISPIALFLFVVFVSFALWNAFGGFGDVDTNIGAPSSAQMENSLANLDEQIADIEKDIAEAKSEPEGAAQLPSLEQRLASTRKARRLTAELMSGGEEFSSNLVKNGDAATPAEKGVAAWLEHAWKKAKSNPGLLLYKLQTNAYKLSWLLIPLSLPFMWLLFPFSRTFRMYDHTVFVTYSIAFIMVLIVISSIGGMLNFAPLVVVPLLYAPVHLYWQLRGTYRLSRGGAFWRLIALSAFIWIVLALFAAVMIGMVI